MKLTESGCCHRQSARFFYEPFLGGGILTALSVPLIISIGSLTFGIASAITTANLIIWGVVRNRHARQVTSSPA